MRHYSLQVNPGQYQGELRNILGMNNSPVAVSKTKIGPQKKLYDDLHIAYIRHHDASLENKGQNIIDVSRIFPLFHLDENDPRNYDFIQTDDYLSIEADSDAQIEFRLGEAIDHNGFHRRVDPPSDPEKWARICANIIRHYAEGWANGMHLNITRLAIWEEPDTVPALFTGDFDTYIDLFIAAYKVLHAAFPKMSIGGPNCGTGSIYDDRFIRFLDRCRENGIEPGFIAFTVYTADIDFIPDTVRFIRAKLDEYGFVNTGISVSEWHLGPMSWVGAYLPSSPGCDFERPQNASYTSSTLIRLMDLPVDAAFFYAWACVGWSSVTLYDGLYRPLPCYYGMKYFTDVACAKKRLAVTKDAEPEVDVLAAETEDGKIRLLVSCYGGAAFDMKVSVPAAKSCTIKGVCEEDAQYTPENAVDLPVENGTARLSLTRGGSAVWLLEFAC